MGRISFQQWGLHWHGSHVPFSFSSSSQSQESKELVSQSYTTQCLTHPNSSESGTRYSPVGLYQNHRGILSGAQLHSFLVASTPPTSCKLLLYSYGLGLGLRRYSMLQDPVRIQKWCKLRRIASSAAAVKMPALSFVRQGYNMLVLVQYFSW